MIRRVKADFSNLPHWPPLLNEALACAYCGQLSAGTFRAVVVPEVPPVVLSPGRRAWAREDLDGWTARRRGIDPSGGERNPWDDV